MDNVNILTRFIRTTIVPRLIQTSRIQYKDQGGFLVYTIILGTPGTEFYYVIVDPGNGQILVSQVYIRLIFYHTGWGPFLGVDIKS
ncbi:MAG: hypothetical protein WA941_20295 [Nitrososphaeraceae archaeon]